MPAAVLTTQEGRYSILEADFPGQGLATIGILLEDPARDELYIRLRRDWDAVAGEDAEVFEPLEDDLRAKASEMGAGRLLSFLEDTLSASVRITDRETVLVRDFESTLNRLYAKHVRSTVAPGRTHIPRWSLQVAAGHFLENAEVEPEGYEEAPPDLRRVTDDLFAAEIVGTSMEPLIPNGSVALFRRFGAGSRSGRLVLVEELGRGGNDRYTVKRYVSGKRQRQDETWSHEAIRLEPLNPEHEAWYLDPEEERYRVIAEFVRVLY
jgi:phage repressor protein C with HTH and peptisase S24 domain